MKDKGITLIALVITIIVLLILAGVTIATLTGDNGILERADQVRIVQDRATLLEKLQTEGMALWDADMLSVFKSKNWVDSDNKVNINELLGSTLSTGNGSGNSDVYKIEEVDSKYTLVYYDEEETKIEIGTIGQAKPQGDPFEYTQEDINETMKYFTYEIVTVTAENLKDYGALGTHDQVIYGLKEELIGQTVAIITGTVGNYYGSNDFPITKVVFPEKITKDGIDYDVVDIGSKYITNALVKGIENIETIIFPDTIKSKLINLEGFVNLKNVKFPSNADEISVSAINGHYRNNVNLNKVIIPSGVKKVSIITQSEYLEELIIPDSVTSIEEIVFEGTKLNIPDSVTNIGRIVFKGIKLSIPNNVANIDKISFEGEELFIPKSVITLGYSNMSGGGIIDCPNLKKIYCEIESNPNGWITEPSYFNWNQTSAEVIWGYKGN